MNDDELRGMIRQAIARHLGAPDAPVAAAAHPVTVTTSLSFQRYTLPRAADDTACLIEPSVRCNHCGYCECHGH
jgi:hypothetical protein